MAFNKILKSQEARWILEEKYKGKRSFLFWYDMIRLAIGYPSAYILGTIPFLSTQIDLFYKPFISREETAFWVTLAINKIRENNQNSTVSILDIFSGSGAIGIAVAQALPHASVFFIEKNPRFVKQIKKNIVINNVQKNTHIIPFGEAQIVKGPYNYIFANPPYLSKKRLNFIQKSVILWEPLGALFAPNDGLFYIRSLIEEAPALLFGGGTLFLEHDPWQKAFILQKCAEKGLFAETFLDQYKHSRMTAISRQ